MRYILRITFAIGSLLTLAISVLQVKDEPQDPIISNETCLECHASPDITMPLENGELISLYIDRQTFSDSIHGQLGYACVQCHTNLGEYPHPDFRAVDKRDLALQLYTSCQRCHSGEYERTLDSAHEEALESGNRDAAICTDCHGAHYTRQLTDLDTGMLLPETRTIIPITCARCHNVIYEKYLSTVHGLALVEENNLDVPTCIDCHGVHNIEDPSTAAFRLNSPEICANCHTDPTLMGKYGLSTEVLETYVADFHGTTVTLFEKFSPNAETNKPVCFDCHGIHDIKRVNDPEKGLHLRENLLARCQVCHPDATSNFPDAWLSHYIPSPDNNKLVYYANLFYKIFIPGTLGGMAVLVVLDLSKKLRDRYGGKKKSKIREAENPEGGPQSINGSHPLLVEKEFPDSSAADVQDGLDRDHTPQEPDIPSKALQDSGEEDPND